MLKRRNLLHVGLVVLLYLVGGSCANPLAPVGGPRDEQPPQLVPEDSTPNLQTNFRPQEIELTFDEWVQIRDAARQIVVSPPLEFPFQTRLRRKTLIFSFDEQEVLRDSATYVINFGEAVQDLTERNPAEDLRFVFATGPIIDTLRVRGQVVDAYTDEPKEGVLFMLYDVLDRDSIVAEEPPFYFARTDSSGRFTVSNVKEGTYRGLALEDTGFDYQYTQPTEPVGFPDTLIRVDADTVELSPVRLYTPDPPLRLTDVDSSRYGQIKLAFSQPPPDSLRLLSEDIVVDSFSREVERDTLRIFFDPTLIGNDPWTLRLAYDTTFRDTLELPVGDRAALLTADTLRIIGGAPSRHRPTRPFPLLFNNPIAGFDTSRIQLLTDTGQTVVPLRSLRADSGTARRLLLDVSWEDDRAYELILLPEAVTNTFGTSNSDTIRRSFTVDPRGNFGNLFLEFTNADSTARYLARLLSERGDLITTYVLEGATTYERAEQGLPPGTYSLDLILDVNRNGRYDPGDYYRGRQPEPVVQRELESLRANWDVVSMVDLGALDLRK